jgi:hypothetical protein
MANLLINHLRELLFFINFPKLKKDFFFLSSGIQLCYRAALKSSVIAKKLVFRRMFLLFLQLLSHLSVLERCCGVNRVLIFNAL